MKEHKSTFLEWLYNIFKKHSILAVSIIVFLLLFVGGMRFNIYISLLFATLDSLFIAAAYLFFYALLKRKNFFKNVTLHIIAIILCLILLSFLITFLELITSKLFFNRLIESIPEEAIHHILLFRFVKNMVLSLGTFSVAQFNYSHIQEEKATQMVIEKELIRFQFLKTQVNPHFL
jgi:hypothetical protein